MKLYTDTFTAYKVEAGAFESFETVEFLHEYADYQATNDYTPCGAIYYIDTLESIVDEIEAEEQESNPHTKDINKLIYLVHKANIGLDDLAKVDKVMVLY